MVRSGGLLAANGFGWVIEAHAFGEGPKTQLLAENNFAAVGLTNRRFAVTETKQLQLSGGHLPHGVAARIERLPHVNRTRRFWSCIGHYFERAIEVETRAAAGSRPGRSSACPP